MKACGIFLVGLVSLSACTRPALRAQSEHWSRLPPAIREELRQVAESLVEIISFADYRVTIFHHLREGDQFIRDRQSPTGYKLIPMGMSFQRRTQKRNGAGLLIFREGHRVAFLTARHVVVPEDTIDVYFRDRDGNPTDVLFSRWVQLNHSVTVRGASMREAEIRDVIPDARRDVAIAWAETELPMGQVYPLRLNDRGKVTWGDEVFMFGFPRGIKQLTSGLVSPSPYPGTFAVDATVRFGFSGGPAFVVDEKETQLRLAGICKSVPYSSFQVVSPEQETVPGEHLDEGQMEHLKAEEIRLVDYGLAYFLDADSIRKFLQEKRSKLLESGIRLEEKYFNP